MRLVSSGGRRTEVQSESDLPTSTRVGSDLGDGLAICQSHPYRLLREKVVVCQLKRA